MSRSTEGLARWTTLGLGLLLSWSVTAETPERFGFGREATPEEIAGWDIDVRPDGRGLPPGSGSALDGQTLYDQKCATCHGIFGEGQGRWPVLVGGYDTLSEDRPDKTVGSYWPYATTLWDYLHRAMPFYEPQSLSDDEVYALTAYVLYLNDIVEEDFIADRDTLPAVEMPNRDGFYFDPRPDVQATACMENCRDPDSIRITWDATELGVTPELGGTTSGEADPGSPDRSLDLAALDPAAGKRVYERACGVCHASGVAGAPRTDDATVWESRVAQGMAVLVEHAINGYQGESGYMPPRGGNSQLSDAEVAAAVAYMLDRHGLPDDA